MSMKIIDLSGVPFSDRNGTYSGQAGSKEGVVYKGEYWFLKYPQNTV